MPYLYTINPLEPTVLCHVTKEHGDGDQRLIDFWYSDVVYPVPSYIHSADDRAWRAFIAAGMSRYDINEYANQLTGEQMRGHWCSVCGGSDQHG